MCRADSKRDVLAVKMVDVRDQVVEFFDHRRENRNELYLR